MGTTPEPRHEPCAGGIVLDPSGRLLMVLRAHPPQRGFWSVPGGHCLPGETPPQACVREVREETGLDVRVVAHAGRVQRRAGPDVVYDIDDYVCTVAGGALRAGDDADDVRWADAATFAALPVVDLLEQTLREWNLLPR